MTPAMAAGVTDRLWDMADLVALWEQYKRRAKRAAYEIALTWDFLRSEIPNWAQEGAVSMKLRITSLSLLTVCCLMLAVAPAMADTLYSNGPYNGTIDAWTINFGYPVSDSFLVANNSSIQDLHFVYWDASSTDVLTTVDMQIGSTSFGGSPQTLSGVTNTFLEINLYGYAIFQADYTFAGVPWSGAGFVTLSNACTISGCSVSQPIYWDENDGVGCPSPGCPSTAYNSSIGSIPSESFTLTGTTGSGTTPEPGSILLFGSGILGLAGVLRRKLKI
jgi:PEP-CTERM motif